MGRRIKKPPYVHHKKDRRGGAGYHYFSRPGYPSARLPGLLYSREFMAAYEAALNGKPLQIGASNVKSGTMAELIAKYYGSDEFQNLELSTRQVYRRIIERMRERFGSLPVDQLDTKNLRRIVSEIQAPTAKKRFLSIFRILLEHAVNCGMISINPAATIKAPKVKVKGFHAWSDEEVEKFEATYDLGTRDRLAFALMLYTGQRRSDAVRMGPQHMKNGFLKVKQKKTGTELSIPVHPDLQATIDASQIGHLAFLVTSQGKPFTANGFGNYFREVCDAAGLPECTAHGFAKLRPDASRRPVLRR